MVAERYESAFARDKKEVRRTVDGKEVTMVRFRAVAKFKAPNPDFIEDSRTANQRKRTVRRQTGTAYELPQMDAVGAAVYDAAKRIMELLGEGEDTYRAWLSELDEDTMVLAISAFDAIKKRPVFERVPNPEYIADTRTATQKRRDVWKQTGTYLEVPKGKGRNAKKQTDTAIANALEAWRAELNEEASKPEEAKQTMVELVTAYVTRREELSKAADWDTSKSLAGGVNVITRSTVRDYRHTVNYLEKTFPAVEVSDLKRRDIKEWEEKQLIAGHSLSRVRKAHVLMKQTLNDAVESEILEANVMASLNPPKLGKRENNSLTQEGAQRFTMQLAMLEPSPLTVGAMLALHCGLRGGEVCGLTWGSVDFEGRHLTVRQSVGVGDGGKFLKTPKSESGNRTIWMDDYVVDVLKKRKAQTLAMRDNISKGFEDLFVVGDVDGGYLSPTTLSRQFTAVSKALGLRGKTGDAPTLHKLRHTFKDALTGGNGLKDNSEIVSDTMGHSRLGITGAYGTRNQELMDEAVKAAAKWLKPKDSTKAQADVLDFPKTGTEG